MKFISTLLKIAILLTIVQFYNCSQPTPTNQESKEAIHYLDSLEHRIDSIFNINTKLGGDYDRQFLKTFFAKLRELATEDASFLATFKRDLDDFNLGLVVGSFVKGSVAYYIPDTMIENKVSRIGLTISKRILDDKYLQDKIKQLYPPESGLRKSSIF